MNSQYDFSFSMLYLLEVNTKLCGDFSKKDTFFEWFIWGVIRMGDIGARFWANWRGDVSIWYGIYWLDAGGCFGVVKSLLFFRGFLYA